LDSQITTFLEYQVLAQLSTNKNLLGQPKG